MIVLIPLLICVLFLTLILAKFLIEKTIILFLIKLDSKFARLYHYAAEKSLRITLNLFSNISHAHGFKIKALDIPYNKKPNVPNYFTFSWHYQIDLSRKIIAYNNGLRIVIFAHEIGHCLINSQQNKIINCPLKKCRCQLLKEIIAWENAFFLLKNLNFKFDENEFWKISAAQTATYFIKDFKYLLTNNHNCPNYLIIGCTKTMQKILKLETKELQKILDFLNRKSNRNPHIPKKIFSINPQNFAGFLFL